ncbi:MAG TPA: ATP-binding protein [Actinomycetota bacterium]|nr:ATP-binding protein [Actinomycetota bacterium]
MSAVAAPGIDWVAANQQHLVAAVDRVREALVRHAAAMGTEASGANPERGAPHLSPTSSALDALCDAFGLSPFERDILVLSAAIELDGSFGELCAAAQGDPAATYPTFGLALAALADPHWSAVTPEGPLRRWRLVELGPGSGVTSAPLHIEERVLHFLTGIDRLDERLDGLILPLETNLRDLLPSQRGVVEAVLQLWRSQGETGEPLSPVQVCGPDGSATRAVAAEVCRAAGLEPFVITAQSIPASPQDLEALARLWVRESVLSGAGLIIDGGESDRSESTVESVGRLIERAAQPVMVIGRDPIAAINRTAVRFDVERPPVAERQDRWKVELGELAASLDGALDRVAGQFQLGGDQIQAACTTFRAARIDAPFDAASLLWDACRIQARPRLDGLAQRLDAAATWEDLVLPSPQVSALWEMAAHCRQRSTVYDAWGFAAKGSRGLGISALFAGASGTGKTMAAEVLAGELRLDLYRIDLSSVVSKYIGETEKNLRRVFDAAEEGAAILLFDEADALFGKRSEVKDSHDRYANIEVSYLLQRMEAYRGLAILTTNLKGALDPAFMRRIRFVVQFPFPGPEERAEIWRRIFPASTPIEALDVGLLARLNVAGGSIRNIAVGAAFLAADAGRAVGMDHVLQAARTEYAKLEKPLTEAEIGGWR